jgi:hypothetical protein
MSRSYISFHHCRFYGGRGTAVFYFTLLRNWYFLRKSCTVEISHVISFRNVKWTSYRLQVSDSVLINKINNHAETEGASLVSED